MYNSKIFSGLAIIILVNIVKSEIRINSRIPQNSAEVRDDLLSSNLETTNTKILHNSAENKDDSSFTIHLSNTEKLKTEIMLEISSKLVERLRIQKTELIKDIDSKMEQKLDKMLEKLSQKMEQQVSALKKILLQEKEHSARVPHKGAAARPTSCTEAILFNNGSSGIYTLYLPDFQIFQVYCLQDPDNGTAWAIIQRRQDNSIDFNRDWKAYASGFGDLNSSYWIGLNRIHAMTNMHEPNELWIEMEDWEGAKRYAKYDYFAIGTENEKYELKILGTYSGNAGNSLVNYHKGLQFTTMDSDNDQWRAGNCAERFKGAFWWCNCGPSNLNGVYLGNVKSSEWEGIHWQLWHYFNYSMRYLHMAIRPKLNTVYF